MLEHSFHGPPFTIGIEEELMILDPERLDLAQGIEQILAAVPADLDGQVKPELLQSVLEIATRPHPTLAEAAAELADLRRAVAGIAEGLGFRIAAAGIHPFAQPFDQKVVDSPRYRELVELLPWMRQEMIFGMHVHVAVEDAERAIYVADGLRRYVPLFLAVSVNSPFWRGERTGLMSTRTPILRGLPRLGIPPHHGSWAGYVERIEALVQANAIEDYTYIWWDVRPHPKFGTVEARAFDQQTRIEDTVALAALTMSVARRLARGFDAGEPLSEIPRELIDESKVRASGGGPNAELFPVEGGPPTAAAGMARALMAEVAEDAEALGCANELAGLETLLADGCGAGRQIAMWERDGDLVSLVRETVEATRP